MIGIQVSAHIHFRRCRYFKPHHSKVALIVDKMNPNTHFVRIFEKYPKFFSLIEIAVYTGIFAFNQWLVPFWHWGIYRLNLAVPESLELLFYKLWHGTVLAGFISITFGLLFFIMSSLIRKDSLKGLGIRLDNLYKSGYECAIISLISIVMILLFSISYSNKFYPHGLIPYWAGFLKYTPWEITKKIVEGLAQQFLLQSVLLIRFIKIFKHKSISVMSAALLFSLAHSPNIRLMALSFCFGLVACVLFLRNKNIFTLAVMHGVLSMIFTSFLVPGLVSDFRKGPPKGNTEFIASIDYHGSKIETKPSKTILIPISVTNKSTVTWDSGDKDHPVFMSYHLFNATGEMMEYDNVRTSFNKRIGTDESVRVDLRVNAPSRGGDYYLEVDIVKEKIAWFENKGSKTALIPLSVN